MLSDIEIEKLFIELRPYISELGYEGFINDEDEEYEFIEFSEHLREFLFIKNNVGYYYDKLLHEDRMTIIDKDSPCCSIYKTTPMMFLETINFHDLHDYSYNEQDDLESITIQEFIADAISLKRKKKIKIILEDD